MEMSVGFPTVSREPHSGRVALRYEWSSYRLISTGQLRESLVLSSTSGLFTQWSSWEPLGTSPVETSS
jgi:hypothetical protein